MVPKTKALAMADAMAEHYVNGVPEVRGRWNESARAAGYVRVPNSNAENILEAIDLARDRSSAAQLADVESMVETDGQDWEALALQLRPLQGQIALGKVRASAAQMKAISEIMLRGFGRITERQKDIVASAVVVLPMLGTGGTATVCPNCMHILEAGDDVAEHIAAMRKDVGQSEVR